MLNLKEHPHRRYNPLTGEWVLVSPHRQQRPWHGQLEETEHEQKLAYDPDCHLCPGNLRAGGVRNPAYECTYVFDNDFAALRLDTPPETVNDSDLLVASGEPGVCRVICFSPRHDLTLAAMTQAEVRAVVNVWATQYQELGSRAGINYVQIFENRGPMMGASNPHPHCHLWATLDISDEVAKEQHGLSAFRRKHGQCLLCEYQALKVRYGTRLVSDNDDFVVVVPFWAVWPFETLVLARQHAGDLGVLPRAARWTGGYPDCLTSIYDDVFRASFPYTMGFHQKPTDGSSGDEWHLHAHFYPPLVRSAKVCKFMVGYELLATPQRDLTPELAADCLRAAAL